jgi:precorrin-6B methylase 2
MRRGHLAVVGSLLAGVVLAAGCGQAPGTNRTGTAVPLTVMLPQDDAELWVDGELIQGEGETREVAVPVPASGRGQVTLKTVWAPNDYTHITRRFKVAVSSGGKLPELDMRKVNPRETDDIVVRFVPTPDDVVEAMCKLAKVGPEDVVYDLGCGDARMVIAAVKKFHAKRGVGVELDPDMVQQSKDNVAEAGVADRVEIRQGDVLKVKDVSDANVVLLYMGDDIDKRLQPILKKSLKPGSRVVSHRFLMEDDWPPDRTITITHLDGEEFLVHLWTIRGEDRERRNPSPAPGKKGP